MYKGILHTHYTVVILFLVIYFVKTILLISNKQDMLKKMSHVLKVPEMIISFLFLGTGIYLLTQLPEVNFLMIAKIALVLISIPLAIIGFKKGNKILASLSFFLLVAAFGIGEAHHGRMGNPKKKVDVAAEGFDAKTFFSDPGNCALCHGADGKKMEMQSPDLSLSTMNRDEMIKIIREGKGVMPKYSNLNEDQARALAAYVETLRAK